MNVFTAIIRIIRNLGNVVVGLFSGLYTILQKIWEGIQTGDTSFIGDIFGKFTDSIWDFISQFNIFGDFGVSILYSWIPESALTGAISYMFGILCLIGSLKLLKKIVPYW